MLRQGRLDELYTLPAEFKRILLRRWPVYARTHQLPPLAPWTNWLLLGGRGAGKTRTGAEWTRAMALGDWYFNAQPAGKIALVAETYADAREVMVEGQSGLLAVHSAAERPNWISSRRRIEWPNGAVAQVFSSEDPDALRGPQFSAAWCDDFGYRPDDGSNDVYFNLDPLWAHNAIDAVGIDNYMPISDWRSSGDPGGIGRQSSDPEMFAANVATGEGYDWYYPSAAHREQAIRAPITDGLGKPWVYRYKDLKSWWQNAHFDRRAGVELSDPTPWQPESKPIIFTELGCPAINNGAAQPNVFVDPKSDESALPYFSNGGRNDHMPLAFIAAHQNHWITNDQNRNPTSSVYGGPMVDFERAQLWAWDARPYPAFPSQIDVWSDYQNWQVGHWLTGRIGMIQLADLIADLLTGSGVAEFDVSQVTGIADGYVIGDGSSARSVLELLIQIYRLSVFEDAGTVHFRSPGLDPITTLALEDIVHAADAPATTFVREQESELPVLVQLNHIDPHFDFQNTQTRAARVNISGVRQNTFNAPLVLGRDAVVPLLEAWLHDRWTARDSVQFGLSRHHDHLTVGDVVAFNDDPLASTWRISRIESGDFLSITANAVEMGEHQSPALSAEFARITSSSGFGRPLTRFLDLPYLAALPDNGGNCIAVSANPWPGDMAVYASPSDEGFSYQQSISTAAFMGKLSNPLSPTTTLGRWDYDTHPQVELFQGELSSQPVEQVLNGAGGLAIQCANGAYEILQFQQAELVAENTYRLSILLRGQAGTDVEAAAGAEEGASVVVLNQAVTRLVGDDTLRGLDTNWLVGPVGKALDGPEFSQSAFSPGYRRLLPYSPVHLKAQRHDLGNDEIAISWIRRDRINADDWAAVEVPMSEAGEAYQVRITSELTGEILRNVSQPALTVTGTEMTEAFGSMPHTTTISVAQVSATVGAGPPTTIQFTL